MTERAQPLTYRILNDRYPPYELVPDGDQFYLTGPGIPGKGLSMPNILEAKTWMIMAYGAYWAGHEGGGRTLQENS